MTIPEKMHALILTEGGYSKLAAAANNAIESLDPWLEYGTLAVPQPGEGEVLIRTRLSSVNPSDLAFIRGIYGQPREQGRAAGFEAVGDVVASGGGKLADGLVGSRVSFITRQSGAWAEYVVAHSAACMPLHPAIRDEDGAAMVVNPMTAAAMFDIVKQDGAKSFVLSSGASQLCKLVAGLAHDEGYRAISIVRRDSQIEPVKALGAAVVLNSQAPGFSSQLKAVLGEEKPRIFLDAVTGNLGSAVFNAMGRGARWIIYGRLAQEPTVITEPGQLIFMDKKVEGFWLVKWNQETPAERRIAAATEVQKRFATGKWKTDIAAIVPLSEAHARLPALFAGANEGKVLLKP